MAVRPAMTEFEGRPADVDMMTSLAPTNYGHFTSMLVDRLRVRGLSLHLQRLSRDDRAVFGVDLDLGRVRHLVRHALVGQAGPIVARVTIFDPSLALGHPGGANEPGVLVTTRPVPQAPPGPLRLRSAIYCRDMPEVKHIGLFGALRHRRAAQLDGYDDVVFTDAHTTSPKPPPPTSASTTASGRLAEGRHRHRHDVVPAPAGA